MKTDSENKSEDFLSEQADNKNEYIDKLTLELFMNKTNYNKYLAKKDPGQYDKLKDYKMKLQKYMVDIVDITRQLIDNPQDPPNTEIGEEFADYSKSIIKYLEMKELETPKTLYKKEEDDETMFDPENMEDSYLANNIFEKPRWSGYKVKKNYKTGVFF